jgi:SAM-dependent methyltransferase
MRLRWSAIALLCGVLPAAAQVPAALDRPEIGQISKDSVWVPTPERVIRRMLQLADVTPEDLVVDLGSGDGRIPIHAARHFGARAIGVELEENLVRVSVAAAREQGVSERARFVRQDLYEFDLSVATVVALYISPGVMTRLKPKLLALRPGTRIVSHQFTLDGWEPDEQVRVEGRNAYLWVVPADLRGSWRVTAGAESLRVQVTQELSQLGIRGERAGRVVQVIGAGLRGSEVRFTAFDRNGAARHYQGRIEGARMSGSSDGMGIAPLAWSAARE